MSDEKKILDETELPEAPILTTPDRTTSSSAEALDTTRQRAGLPPDSAYTPGLTRGPG